MRFVAPKRSEAKGVTLMDRIKESSSCLLQFIENVVVGERGIAIDAVLCCACYNQMLKDSCRIKGCLLAGGNPFSAFFIGPPSMGHSM